MTDVGPIVPEPGDAMPSIRAAALRHAKQRARTGLYNLIVLAVMLALCWGCWSKTKSKPVDDHSKTVVSACEEAVKAQLKAPSTAVFSDERYTDNAPDWGITGTVDAEDSSGAMIRHQFGCDLIRSGNNIEVTDVAIR